MAITIREQIDNAASGTAAISLTPTTSLVGDTLVVVHADNFHTAADLTAPTGTAVSSWGTVKFTLDGGTNDGHAKVWMGTVTTAGGTVVEGTVNTDHERYLGVWVLAGPINFDTASGTDPDASSTSHVAPSVTPTVGKTDDLLICLFGTANGLGSQTVDYTMPGGSMTAGTEYDPGAQCTYRAGWEQLASDAATGTRTATASVSRDYIAMSVLVSSTAAAGSYGPARPGKTWRHRFHHPQKQRYDAVVSLAADQPLAVTGISGAEILGAAAVTPGAVTITAAGISGAEAVGTAALTQTIAATGIGSAETAGQAATGQGLVAAGIPSGEQSGQTTVTATATISVAGIASAERSGQVTATQVITAAGIGSVEASGQSAIGQGLVASGIGSAERSGAHTATPGAVTVTVAGIGSGEAVGQALVSLGAPQALTAAAISGQEQSGAHTVTVGPAVISPAGIPTAERVGSATVTPGPVTVTAAGIPTLVALGQAVAANQLVLFGIPGAERFGQPTLEVLAPTGEGDLTVADRPATSLTAGTRGASALAAATRATGDIGSGDRAASTLTSTRRDSSTLTGG